MQQSMNSKSKFPDSIRKRSRRTQRKKGDRTNPKKPHRAQRKQKRCRSAISKQTTERESINHTNRIFRRSPLESVRESKKEPKEIQRRTSNTYRQEEKEERSSQRFPRRGRNPKRRRRDENGPQDVGRRLGFRR